MTSGAVMPIEPDSDIPGIARLRGIVADFDASDPSRYGHSQRVAYSSVLIAVRINACAGSLQRLMLAAHLHDVGCVSVPRWVLETTTAYEHTVRELVEAHVVAGEQALVDLGLLREAVWVRHHHERWDGRGYPDGLAGERIPLESRIIAGAERLQALTSSRRYRSALAVPAALARLEFAAGTTLDPAVARVAIALLQDGVIAPRGTVPTEKRSEQGKPAEI
jgi:HD-GYP domain-containing protein (c-di-GMP phosphodiesterase class II)